MKKILIIALLALPAYCAFAQTKEDASIQSAKQKLTGNKPDKEAAVVSAMANAPASSGLTYSSLSQYLQSTVTGGTNGGFNFKTTIFGLKYLFAGKRNDSLSGYYLSHKADRNQEISLGVNKTSKTSDQLSVITLGYKFAINHRDKSIINFAKMDSTLANGIDLADHSMNIVNDIYSGEMVLGVLKTAQIDNVDKQKIIAAANAKTLDKVNHPETNKWTNNEFELLFTGTTVSQSTIVTLETQLDKELSNIPTLNNTYTAGKAVPAANSRYSRIADSVFNYLGFSYAQLHKNLQNEYKIFAQKIETGSLTTFSFNPGYNIQKHHADTSSFTVRYLKGFGNFKKPWNVDLQGVVVSVRDSAAAPKDFGHNKLKFIAGINKVFALDAQSNPLFESELAAEYDDVITGRYAHERKDVVTANIVTTIHLSKEFSLPLTLKYDIKNPALFGFLAVQWNLQSSTKK